MRIVASLMQTCERDSLLTSTSLTVRATGGQAPAFLKRRQRANHPFTNLRYKVEIQGL
jgi:hypothetical protein